jgi:hypothetical protein
MFGGAGISSSAVEGPGIDGGGFDLVALEELCLKASGVDASLVGDEELLAAAAALEGVRGLLEATQAHVLEQLHLRAVTDREYGHRVGNWLAMQTVTSKKRCNGRARTADRLMRWFAEFDQAVCDRRVGWAHAELLCQIANARNQSALAEVQEQLIETAGEFTFEQWAQLVRQLAEQLDTDGGYDPNEDLHANRLRLSPNADATIVLTGRLVGEARITVDQTLETLADELFAKFTRDREQDPELEIPTRNTLMALALEEACRRALTTDLETTQPAKIEAVVVITEGDNGAEFTKPDGTPLPDPAAHLLTDAYLQPLIIDTEGNPLRYGRTRRYATPKQHQALAIRDGGCIFPGCDMPPAHCDAHHQPPFNNSGTTDTQTMGLLCRHHHRVTHRPNWHTNADPQRPQHWTWTTPNGRTLHSQRHQRPPPRM